jgi:hypothetical protein
MPRNSDPVASSSFLKPSAQNPSQNGIGASAAPANNGNNNAWTDFLNSVSINHMAGGSNINRTSQTKAPPAAPCPWTSGPIASSSFLKPNDQPAPQNGDGDSAAAQNGDTGSADPMSKRVADFMNLVSITLTSGLSNTNHASQFGDPPSAPDPTPAPAPSTSSCAAPSHIDASLPLQTTATTATSFASAAPSDASVPVAPLAPPPIQATSTTFTPLPFTPSVGAPTTQYGPSPFAHYQGAQQHVPVAPLAPPPIQASSTTFTPHPFMPSVGAPSTTQYGPSQFAQYQGMQQQQQPQQAWTNPASVATSQQAWIDHLLFAPLSHPDPRVGQQHMLTAPPRQVLELNARMAREDPAGAQQQLAWLAAREQWSARIAREHQMFPSLWAVDRTKNEKKVAPPRPEVPGRAAAPPWQRPSWMGPRAVDYVPRPVPRHTYQPTDRYIRLPPPPQYDNPVGPRPRVPRPQALRPVRGRSPLPTGSLLASFAPPPPVLSQRAPPPMVQLATSGGEMNPKGFMKVLLLLLVIGWFLTAIRLF